MAHAARRPADVRPLDAQSCDLRGQNLLEQPVTFETGQQYTNVQVVVTDKPTQLDLRVTGDDGQPTREYIAIAFPFDKAKWDPQLRQVRTHVPRKSCG